MKIRAFVLIAVAFSACSLGRAEVDPTTTVPDTTQAPATTVVTLPEETVVTETTLLPERPVAGEETTTTEERTVPTTVPTEAPAEVVEAVEERGDALVASFGKATISPAGLVGLEDAPLDGAALEMARAVATYIEYEDEMWSDVEGWEPTADRDFYQILEEFGTPEPLGGDRYLIPGKIGLAHIYFHGLAYDFEAEWRDGELVIVDYKIAGFPTEKYAYKVSDLVVDIEGSSVTVGDEEVGEVLSGWIIPAFDNTENHPWGVQPGTYTVMGVVRVDAERFGGPYYVPVADIDLELSDFGDGVHQSLVSANDELETRLLVHMPLAGGPVENLCDGPQAAEVCFQYAP